MNDAKYIGLDVHQATISAAVRDSDGKFVLEAILETKAETMLQFIHGLRGSLHVTFFEGDDPPAEMELEIIWQEHELANYPSIGLVWDDPMRGTPWNYISRCEAALIAFENSGELPPAWTMPPVRSEDELNEPFDPDKPPSEPPEILDLFESQRYFSNLIQWLSWPSNR
jgi:hypothetical protein